MQSNGHNDTLILDVVVNVIKYMENTFVHWILAGMPIQLLPGFVVCAQTNLICKKIYYYCYSNSPQG